MFGKVRTCVLNMPMNEGQGDPHDSSGYGNNGTNHGADWVSGDFGWAMDFNGSSDYIDCGNDGVLDFTSENFTLSAWVYIDSFPYIGCIIFRQSDPSIKQGYNLDVRDDGKVHFFIPNGIDWNGISALISPDEWHYISGIYDHTKSYIYIDGVEAVSSPFNHDIISNNGRFGIGGRTVSPIRSFAGGVDDVRVCNRALSAAEILAYFNATKARHGL